MVSPLEPASMHVLGEIETDAVVATGVGEETGAGLGAGVGVAVGAAVAVGDVDGVAVGVGLERTVPAG
jgi:hypothetical protein